MMSAPEVSVAEQDVDSDYPDRGGPVEEPPSQRGKKEETIDQEHKVPKDPEREKSDTD